MSYFNTKDFHCELRERASASERMINATAMIRNQLRLTADDGKYKLQVTLAKLAEFTGVTVGELENRILGDVGIAYTIQCDDRPGAEPWVTFDWSEGGSI